jgi:hypothetical protein
MRFLYHRPPGRIENLSAKWHVTATDAGKAENAIRSAGRSIATRLSGTRGTYGNTRDKEHLMLDIVMLALGLGFFVAGIGYAYACERL